MCVCGRVEGTEEGIGGETALRKPCRSDVVGVRGRIQYKLLDISATREGRMETRKVGMRRWQEEGNNKDDSTKGGKVKNKRKRGKP